jgi:uncharacterized phage-associated protein
MILNFNAEKAIEIILYIAKRAPKPDIYHVLKIMYFADKEHLEKYGRFVCNDSYVAMSHGPVPSGSYDIVKSVRGNGYSTVEEHARNSFEIQLNDIISPLRDPDLDMLSDSNEECLKNAIKKYGKLTFSQLKKRSHDKAFMSADNNDFIPIESIVATLQDGDLLIQHLKEN